MRDCLIINPNTTVAVTEKLRAAAEDAVRSQGKRFNADVSICAVTAPFGSAYISSEASYVVAGHAVLEAWASAREGRSSPFHKVLIGCFGDPGLFALREVAGDATNASREPIIIGLAEAAFAAAAKHGRFAVVTGGVRWKPMLERLANNLGYTNQFQAIHTLDADGAALAANPSWAVTVLEEACIAASRLKPDAIIVGGAGLTGFSRRFSTAALEQIGVPVIDSVEAAVSALVAP